MGAGPQHAYPEGERSQWSLTSNRRCARSPRGHTSNGFGDAVLDRADHVVHLKEPLPEFQRTLTAQRSEPRVTRNQLHEPAVPFLVPCEDSSIALP